MNRDEQIKEIREKCIAANPEISVRREIETKYGDYFEEDKIRLADVLLAIRDNQEVDVLIQVSWENAYLSKIGDKNTYGKIWYFRADDLDQQSDDCVTFISSLLKSV